MSPHDRFPSAWLERVIRAVVLAVAFAMVLVLGGPPLSPPQAALAADIYGPGIGADSLNNSQVGGRFNQRVAYRFRATQSSKLSSITIYIATGPGYSGGSGGRLHITVREDDGTADHNPGSILASRYVTPKAGAGRVYSFPEPPPLVAGSLYHVVFSNSDDAPRTNFVSVNGLYRYGANNARQPSLPRTDWANLVRPAGGDWSAERHPGTGTITPIMALNYANGRTSGLGYMEVWTKGSVTISGPQRVREVFTVRGKDRRVKSVSVRVKRVSGSGKLTVELRSKGGKELRSISRELPKTSRAKWLTLEFKSPITLKEGSGYRLVLRTGSGTKYRVTAIRQGSTYRYGGGTYFSAGRAEYRGATSGWQDFSAWGQPNPEGDLQFYFGLVPSDPGPIATTD